MKMEKRYYWLTLILIVLISYLIYKYSFRESNVEEKIETSSCEELRDSYINFNLCKNLYGQDVCRGKLLFEYMDRCV